MQAPPVVNSATSHHKSSPEDDTVTKDGFSSQEAVTSRRYTLTNAQQESLVGERELRESHSACVRKSHLYNKVLYSYEVTIKEPSESTIVLNCRLSA